VGQGRNQPHHRHNLVWWCHAKATPRLKRRMDLFGWTCPKTFRLSESTTSRSKTKADGAAHPPISASVEPHRSEPNISVHLPMTGRDQSPWTEYKQHLRIKQAGNFIIAYDRKMKEFAIKEVKGCRNDWLLVLKAILPPNIVRFVAGFSMRAYLLGLRFNEHVACRCTLSLKATARRCRHCLEGCDYRIMLSPQGLNDFSWRYYW
jgi:hypothetical protein